jgi:methanogenic corrinoid protein MtbC1
MSNELTEAVIDLREADALRITDELLESGVDPLTIVVACKEAMDIVGRRFADGRAFIPELVMAGEIMQAISGKVKPRLAAGLAEDTLGVVVLCTVQGDIHDIGKDIVGSMLVIAGFDVHDLGVDVAIPKLVEKVRRLHPQIVGLSGMLTVAFDSMKASVVAIDQAGLRSGLRIMVGGAPVNADVCTYVGADGWGQDAVEAVALARTWTGGA